jgi:hypothetical protein
MGPDIFRELKDRASISASLDEITRLEAQTHVADVIEQLKVEGKALELSHEEEQMLRSFRRFKLRMRKNGEVFTWQIALPEDVELIKETGFIIHPNEVVNAH